MLTADYNQLLDDLKREIASDPNTSFAILGHTPVSYDLISFFRGCGIESRLLGIYSDSASEATTPGLHKLTRELASDMPDVVIVTEDANKEAALLLAAPYLSAESKVLIGGYGHLAFRDALFENAVQESMVPSLANGYPNSLIHVYQCLKNAARLQLTGVVVEFGMFKGGTTLLLSQFIHRLGQPWKVFGFETFCGFPKRRSVLDMYSHPDCEFTDEVSVRTLLKGRNVEVVSGDIVETVTRLRSEDVVLAFIDTDNYSSATAILDTIQDRVVVGGALVFDHFTGRNRFRYTLGERLAAMRLLEDKRYFNLHETGVFFKQC